MRYLLLILLLLPTLLFAQEFEFVQEWNTIPLISDSLNLAAPWLGGYYFSSSETYDLNNDGDFDLLVGGYFQLDYFINEGNALVPEFTYSENQLIDSTMSNYYYTYPAVCDIDSDGDGDLFALQTDGASVITFFENIGSPIQPEFVINQDTLRDENDEWIWGGNMDWIDIDADGDLDFFDGRYNGELRFYENVGDSTQYILHHITDHFEGIDFGYQGYPNPCFVDIDSDNDYDLVLGHHDGKLYFYENIGSQQQVDLADPINYWLGINVGDYSSPELCDIDNDSDYDIVTSGGWDVVTRYYENRGTPLNPFFIYRGVIIPPDTVSSPTFGDLDDDGDYDMLMGFQNWSGGDSTHLWYYENQGTPEEFNFVLVDQNYFGIVYNVGANFDLVDWDLDSDYDLLVGTGYSDLIYYENVGSPQVADFVCTGQFSISPYWGNLVGLHDVDNDQDIDIFAGQLSGGITFFRNVTGQNEVGPKRPDTPFPKLDFSIGPNPANPVTWISFTLPSPQEATLAVYNILGAKVTTLTSGIQPPGTHTHIWDAAEYSSGVYIIQLETPQQKSAERITVVK
ncbi:hypothetical protein CEE37_06450 [candidate division LCP-89 bacterium B3_LCP]|uniref:Secretion system C-terminal sorting domain-containing protein n=1 Tax=candidate division LCP-89 bacterium B3_LCP TaxID=2012998 RepID=A0A532V2E6_UNCL8|nr:MAG: hypothetical protein CEE37_06450 [candidate division LCP-89 bacterium B3_LCP]